MTERVRQHISSNANHNEDLHFPSTPHLSKLSSPLSVLVLMGTPTTGSGVMLATIPGKCAAPPAPATMHCIPLDAAPAAKATIF